MKTVNVQLVLLVVVVGMSIGACGQPVRNGISSEEARQQKPPHPGRLIAHDGADGVVLSWPGIGLEIQKYQFYRTTKGTTRWESLGEVVPTRDQGATYTFHDRSGRLDDYVYGVTVVNVYGNESDLMTSDGRQLAPPLK
jgi:hypothetical protein